jgi:hypothetical protein
MASSRALLPVVALAYGIVVPLVLLRRRCRFISVFTISPVLVAFLLFRRWAIID